MDLEMEGVSVPPSAGVIVEVRTRDQNSSFPRLFDQTRYSALVIFKLAGMYPQQQDYEMLRSP